MTFSTMGRIQRQMVAASALSVALSAVVLLVGGLVVNRVADEPLPSDAYAASPTGVLKVATPAAALPSAPRARELQSPIPSPSPTVAYATAASRPALTSGGPVR